MSTIDVDRRRVSTVLTGQEWGALDRLRENRGDKSIAVTLHAIVVEATGEHDHLLSHASRMGDAGPLLRNTSVVDTPRYGHEEGQDPDG